MKSMYENPLYESVAPENETDGMYDDEPLFCPDNAYGDCPYCDQCNLCHMKDPQHDCDAFMWEE